MVKGRKREKGCSSKVGVEILLHNCFEKRGHKPHFWGQHKSIPQMWCLGREKPSYKAIKPNLKKNVVKNK